MAAVVLKEVSVERLGFTCGGCGQSWSADYDVQHVEDGHGHERDYYFHDGLPCPDPTAPEAMLCPRCRRGHVAVEMLARRASPAVTETTTGDLGTRPGSEKTAARADAPLLAAHGTTTEANS